MEALEVMTEISQKMHVLTGILPETGQMLLTNMTLYSSDDVLIIMMERFEPLTTSVDCKGDDGEMSLTFRSEDAFRHTLQQWSYINDNEEGKFLLIANHAGCGPDDRRQPYLYVRIGHGKLKSSLMNLGQYIKDHRRNREAQNSPSRKTSALVGGSRHLRP